MNELSAKALLVSLNISQWAARKLDKRESAIVEARNDTCAGAARVNKSLLPMASSLDRIHKLTGAIRTDYYKLTLPWDNGTGIIKAESYLAFAQTMSDHKLAWQQAVNKFVDEYDQLREDSKHLLGDLYREEDYPQHSEVARKFSIDLAFYPVPDAGDWRVSLGDEEIAALREQITSKVQESEARAMSEAWRRVFEVVEKAHERLASPDNVFRDSLIDNAKELCAILPTLNITDDPQLESMRREIERSLCGHDPQDLREDEGLRSEVSEELDALMRKMAGYM